MERLLPEGYFDLPTEAVPEDTPLVVFLVRLTQVLVLEERLERERDGERRRS